MIEPYSTIGLSRVQFSAFKGEEKYYSILKFNFI